MARSHELPASIAAACGEVGEVGRDQTRTWARSSGRAQDVPRSPRRCWRGRGEFEAGRRDGGNPQCADAWRDRRGDVAAQDLIEFKPGRVARWTGRGCAGGDAPTRCNRRRWRSWSRSWPGSGWTWWRAGPVGAAAERGRWPMPLVSSRSPRQLLPTAVQRAPDFTAAGRTTSHLGARHRAATSDKDRSADDFIGPAAGEQHRS